MREPRPPRKAGEVWSLPEGHNAWCAWCVGAFAIAVGVWVFADYWSSADHLWWSSQHDRNAHYLEGLTLAMSVRSGEWYSFLDALERMQVWGILHPVLLGVIQVIAGPDSRLAVLPSFLMWIGSIVLAFVLTRSLAPGFGNVSGMLAALLLAASPAHRAFGVDAMLESGGAFLTLAALLTYTRYATLRTARAAVYLVVACLALFFWKYNYWLLVTIALAASEFGFRRGEAIAALKRPLQTFLSMLRALPRNPMLVLAFGVLAFGGFVLMRGPTTISIGPWTASFTRHHGIVHVGWVLFCLQAVIWWRRSGRGLVAAWHAPDRVVVLGLLVPIGVWFLIPKRLGAFLWFLSPLNSDQTPAADAFDGFRRYAAFIESDYFTHAWFVPAAFVLSAVGLLGTFRRGRGAAVLFVFLGVATLLTFKHPMVKSRFMHSWIAVLFLTGGIGISTCLVLLGRWSITLARATAVIVLAALGTLLAPWLVVRGRAQESGLRPDSSTTLSVTRPLVDALPPNRPIQIVSNEAECWTLQWACLERARVPSRVKLDIRGYRRTERNPAALAPWLATTDRSVIVMVDVPKHSPFYTGYGIIDLAPVRAALLTERRFVITSDLELPAGERITVWVRDP